MSGSTQETRMPLVVGCCPFIRDRSPVVTVARMALFCEPSISLTPTSCRQSRYSEEPGMASTPAMMGEPSRDLAHTAERPPLGSGVSYHVFRRTLWMMACVHSVAVPLGKQYQI